MNITIDYDKKTGEYKVTANLKWEAGVKYLVGIEGPPGKAFENNPRFCVDDADIECEIYEIIQDEIVSDLGLANKEFRQFITDALFIVKVVPSNELKIKFKKRPNED